MKDYSILVSGVQLVSRDKMTLRRVILSTSEAAFFLTHLHRCHFIAHDGAYSAYGGA